MIKNLGNSFPSSSTALVSLYLRHPAVHDVTNPELPFVKVLLTEIEKQLRLSVSNSNQGRRASRSEATPQVSKPPGCTELRRMIASHLKLFDRVFLVLDDLDVAWVDLSRYLELEDELANLKTLGIKILATSRVAFRSDTDLGVCDVDDSHKSLNLWWECNACKGANYYICDICKESGHRCPKP